MPATGILPLRTSRPAGRSSRRSALPGRSGRPPRRALHLAGWLTRNRRLAVALLLCLAAGIAVHQLTPAPAHTVRAIAAARDLPAGAALGGGDVAAVSIPPSLLAAGSFTETSGLEGKQLAAPLRKGQLLSDAQLVGPGLLTGAPPGSAAVPLRMADPASIRLVSPGQLVNVVLTNGNGYEQASSAKVLASSVPVLWTSGQEGQSGQWLGTSDSEGLIVVAATPTQASALAGASTQGKLFFVLVGSAGG
ncbi:Flp pilus assembly protein CpaB [Arthrobacter sp. Soil736]|uniref:Flp pilus assembly protein CpaB n=1 Tax=Arthrobacter sp. Soil736 TaxID=1736395 RepID=UPI0009EC8583|nr:Flp pilus assembly protein CpaB [Arthrobacter sp. Soil736]